VIYFECVTKRVIFLKKFVPDQEIGTSSRDGFFHTTKTDSIYQGTEGNDREPGSNKACSKSSYTHIPNVQYTSSEHRMHHPMQAYHTLISSIPSFTFHTLRLRMMDFHQLVVVAFSHRTFLKFNISLNIRLRHRNMYDALIFIIIL